MRAPLGAAVVLLVAALAGAAQAAGYRESEVREAVTEAGFGAIADRVAEVSLPTVFLGRRLLGRMPRERGSSRLGGWPDLPVGARWPRCRRGTQTFLGQIRLADLPVDATPLREHGGVLLLFTHVRFESGDSTEYGLWGGRCTTVLHAPEGAALVRTRAPRRAQVMRLRPAELRFRMRADVPDTSTDFDRLAAPLHDITMSAAQLEAWWELRFSTLHRHDSIVNAHRLLGYIEAPNGDERCWKRTQRRRGAWRHLVTIGLDYGVGFEVADGGRIQVTIPPADLRAGRFDRVCGVFDSS